MCVGKIYIILILSHAHQTTLDDGSQIDKISPSFVADFIREKQLHDVVFVAENSNDGKKKLNMFVIFLAFDPFFFQFTHPSSKYYQRFSL